MSFERVTYIIIILQLNMSHTFTVNIEYGKSDLNAAYPQEIVVMIMFCRCPRDEAAVL